LQPLANHVKDCAGLDVALLRIDYFFPPAAMDLDAKSLFQAKADIQQIYTHAVPHPFTLQPL
jgi:hypothetical protein